MMRNTSLIALAFLLFTACTETKNTEEDFMEKAKRIHANVITVDTHCDIDTDNFTSEINYTQDISSQVTLPKMKEGGLDVAWFIVYTGQDSLTTAGYAAAYDNAIDKFDAIHRLTTKYAPDQIELALTSDDVRRIHAAGKKVAMIGVENGYPIGLFSQIEGEVEIGTELVSHPSLKAVGFTGSFQGGKALFDIANKRNEPIPVFAEMGSVNPLFLLPKKLKSSDSDLAVKYVESLTLGSGQFCTNPGLLVAMKVPELQEFIAVTKQEISKKSAEKMLHQGIASNYLKNSTKITDHSAVKIIATGEPGDVNSGQAILAVTSASDFLKNEHFCGEVFGPFGLIVECENKQEMENIAAKLDGQLTATLLADEDELEEYINLKSILIEKCGRLILNNFPTGVEVCMAMQHGGPFPCSTDSRFTSVGADAIKRFMRPFCYQNWPDNQLPDELKNGNPLNLLRTINETNTTQSIKNL